MSRGQMFLPRRYRRTVLTCFLASAYYPPPPRVKATPTQNVFNLSRRIRNISALFHRLCVWSCPFYRYPFQCFQRICACCLPLLPQVWLRDCDICFSRFILLCFLRGDCRPIESITTTRVSTEKERIAGVLVRVDSASLGDRDLQDTAEGNKRTRITAMAIQVPSWYQRAGRVAWNEKKLARGKLTEIAFFVRTRARVAA